MALINCPECGKAVSQRAATCPECGYPLQDPRFPQDYPDYAVVVLAVGNAEGTAKGLSKLGLPQDETRQLLEQAPVLLGRDLTYARAQELCNYLSLTSARYKAISTHQADEPDQWETIPPALPPKNKGKSFWQEVGIIALGVGLGILGTMLVTRLLAGLIFGLL